MAPSSTGGAGVLLQPPAGGCPVGRCLGALEAVGTLLQTGSVPSVGVLPPKCRSPPVRGPEGLQRVERPRPWWTPVLPVADPLADAGGQEGQASWDAALPTNVFADRSGCKHALALPCQGGTEPLPGGRAGPYVGPAAAATCPGASRTSRPPGAGPAGPGCLLPQARVPASVPRPRRALLWCPGGLCVAGEGTVSTGSVGWTGTCSGNYRALPCAPGHPAEKAIPPGDTGHVGLQGAAGVGPGAGSGRHRTHLQAGVSPQPSLGRPLLGGCGSCWGPSHVDTEKPLLRFLGSGAGRVPLWEPLADSRAPYL